MNDAKQGVVREAIVAMQGAPLALGLLLFNLIWLAAVGYFAAKSSDRWENVVQTVLKTCGPAAK